MKWLRTIILFDNGDVISTDGWQDVHSAYTTAVEQIEFPEGSGSLTLRKKLKRVDGQFDRNGVGYLKKSFLHHLVTAGWKAEASVNLDLQSIAPTLLTYPQLEAYQEPVSSEFGGFDFMTETEGHQRIAIEWETGNISSSHRSMNKLAIALTAGIIEAGVLIVPSRNLYEHLTDRIGNIGELSGYLSMWKSLETSVERGLLAVTVVEHDSLTDDEGFPYLPSGADGRAKQGRAKRS